MHELQYFEKDYPITFAHIDNRGIARPSALFEIMQDAATEHADALHLSPGDLGGALWVLSRLHCAVIRPVRVHEVIHVRTWCAGIKGATWLRAFALSVDGEELGQALSAWVVLDHDSHRILRPTQIPAARDYLALAPSTCPAVPGKLLCAALTPHHVHTVRYSDLDVNGHMNNVKIVDVVCDGLELDRQDGRFVSEIQVNYTAECMPGEQITLAAGQGTDGLTYVFGAADGAPKFEAAAKLSLY